MSTWREISERIGKRIDSGEFSFGAILPGESDFAQEYSVSRSTVQRALSDLEAKGYVEARKRAGTRVIREKKAKSTWWDWFLTELRRILTSQLQK